MPKRFKEKFDFVRIELRGWKFVRVHYKGTKSTYPFGWKKKPKANVVAGPATSNPEPSTK